MAGWGEPSERECGLNDSLLVKEGSMSAPFTSEGRRRMVACVVERGWTIATERFQVRENGA